MTPTQATSKIKELLATFCDFSANIEDVTRFFTPDYQQKVDGEVIDLVAFIDHVHALRTKLVSLDIDVQRIVSDGMSAATVHVARATKRDGDVAIVKVVAFYQFDGDRVASIDEATHVLEGSTSDRQLGSTLS